MRARVVHRAPSRQGEAIVPSDKQLIVVWDDSCSFCAWWVRWFGRLDWRHRLGFRPLSGALPAGVTREAATEALQLVRLDGRIQAGYAAVVGIAAHLPLTAPFTPVLLLLTWPGDRMYRRLARNRRCRTRLQPSRSGGHPA